MQKLLIFICLITLLPLRDIKAASGNIDNIFMPNKCCWNKLAFRKPQHLHLLSIKPVMYPWQLKGYGVDPQKTPILFLQKNGDSKIYTFKVGEKLQKTPIEIKFFDPTTAKAVIYDFGEQKSFELRLNQPLKLEQFLVTIIAEGTPIVFRDRGEKKSLNNKVLMLLDFHYAQKIAIILETPKGETPSIWVLFNEQENYNEQKLLTKTPFNLGSHER